MEAEESFERAVADLEMLAAMYPDETSVSEAVSTSTSTFPLQVTFRFSETAHIQLALVVGYLIDTGIQVVSYRSSPEEKARMEEAVTVFRSTAKECLDDGIEGCYACCAAALETWNDFDDGGNDTEIDPSAEGTELAQHEPEPQPPEKVFHWISGEPLVDRKSTFIAHACRISSDKDVREALHQLLDGNVKLKRTTHNMSAYRFTEQLPGTDDRPRILKHDNDDDGEDAAGSRLAHLLEMRQEDGVFVVVSRWFGGIKLGPKRFAHITNVAGQLLLHCHEHEWKDEP